jgi:hypothetical protein
VPAKDFSTQWKKCFHGVEKIAAPRRNAPGTKTHILMLALSKPGPYIDPAF